MRLLLDTHIIIWVATQDRRLSTAQRNVLADPVNELYASAVVAYEFAHLQRDHRIPLTEPFSAAQDLIGFELLDLPSQSWSKVAELPLIHRDPVDRMLIAHALVAGMTIITADRHIRQYAVPTI